MEDISLHILDIAQNSIRAGATRVEVEIVERPAENLLSFTIKDDGCGMTEDQLSRLHDPFFTTRETRRVGLGIPLLKQTAEQAGGGLKVASEPGEGTTVEARYEYDNVDTPPLGDVAATLWTLIVTNADVDFDYVHARGARRFELSTAELKETLRLKKLSMPGVAKALRKYIDENEQRLTARAGAAGTPGGKP